MNRGTFQHSHSAMKLVYVQDEYLLPPPKPPLTFTTAVMFVLDILLGYSKTGKETHVKTVTGYSYGH